MISLRVHIRACGPIGTNGDMGQRGLQITINNPIRKHIIRIQVKRRQLHESAAGMTTHIYI